jgi:hypothetical protein
MRSWLPLSFRAGPFEKAISWHDATALLKGFAEGWPLFERFGFGVDALAGAAVVFRTTIDQTPACAARFAPFEF